MKECSFREMMHRYNEYYDTNRRPICYKNEDELKGIIKMIYHFNEERIVELDYNNKKIIISE